MSSQGSRGRAHKRRPKTPKLSKLTQNYTVLIQVPSPAGPLALIPPDRLRSSSGAEQKQSRGGLPEETARRFRAADEAVAKAKAGLDLGTLREQYGQRLILFGNIDVRKLAGTKDEIEEEIRTKLLAAGPSGGYIYHSDHSVPNNVSLDNYRFALDMVRRLGRYE